MKELQELQALPSPEKGFLNHPQKWPLWLQIILLMIVLVLILGYASGELARSYEQRYLEQNLERQGQKLFSLLSGASLDAIISEDRPILDSIISQSVERVPDLHKIVVQNESGKVLSSWQADVIEKNHIISSTNSVELAGEKFGSIIIEWSVAHFHSEIQSHVRDVRLFTLLMLTFMSMIITAGISLLTVRPINAINRRLLRLADGELDERFSLSSSREFIRVSESFNMLCATIRLKNEQEQQQRELLEQEVAERTSELKCLYEQVKHQSLHDSLTGLPNRVLLHDRMSQTISRLAWHDRLLAVLFLDLDRFKIVNDSLGHSIGDELLTQVAERLCGCVREGDTVSRLSGDEFVIMLNDMAAKSDVTRVADLVLDTISKPFVFEKHEFVVNCSIGIALFPNDGDNPLKLLKKADLAMYEAKASGRNMYRLYDASMDDKLANQLAFEAAMRTGLERGEFILHYQPQVSLETGEITGVEALARWQRADGTLVPPFKFIAIAEETGLIIPMGEHLLYEACKQAKAWIDAGLRPISVSVNIADRQFKQDGLPDLVRKVLQETGLPPQYLELELTEGILMEQVDKATKLLDELKATGINLSLDDFGTGYSSLAYLKRFAIDTLKIDRSFIMDTPDDSDDVAITSAIIEMGKSLQMSVVAEGVENSAQLEFLQTLHCKTVQGYYFSPPVPADEIVPMLKKGQLFPK